MRDPGRVMEADTGHWPVASTSVCIDVDVDKCHLIALGREGWVLGCFANAWHRTNSQETSLITKGHLPFLMAEWRTLSKTWPTSDPAAAGRS